MRFYSATSKAASSLLSVNKSVSLIPASGIRDIMLRADGIARLGNNVIRLEVGQPNFSSPKHVLEATCAAIMEGKTTYIPNAGLWDLRQAISEVYYSTRRNIKTSPENIIVTTGSTLSLYSLLMTILSPSDECLVPIPGFPNYCQSVSLVGATPIPYLCHPGNDFKPRLDELEKLLCTRTKCIIICNPGNPTGTNFSRDFISSIVKFAQVHDLFLISDEIYADIVFEGSHTCAAEFDIGVSDSKLAVVAGVSKGYAMTGFRVGWTRSSPQMIGHLTKIQEPLVSCGSPFTQYAAIAALRGPQDCLHDMVRAYKSRRDAALNTLAARGRPSAYVPGGAFYLPVDITSSGLPSLEFALKLLEEKHCAVAPGLAFDTGNTGGPIPASVMRAEHVKVMNSFCRVSLANSLENVELGLHRICDLLDELDKK